MTDQFIDKWAEIMIGMIQILKKEIRDREEKLDESLRQGYLRINHGEGAAQYREIKMLRHVLRIALRLRIRNRRERNKT